MTSDETSKVFTELGISGPSSSSCDPLPKRLSAVWESHRASWESALRQQEVVAAEAVVVAVSLLSIFSAGPDAIEATTEIQELSTDIDGATTDAKVDEDGTATVWINLPEGDLW